MFRNSIIIILSEGGRLHVVELFFLIYIRRSSWRGKGKKEKEKEKRREEMNG